MKTLISKVTGFGLVVALLALLVLPFSQTVLAAGSISTASDAMSSQKVSQYSNHDIQFTTPTGVASGQTIIITFPADFVASTTLDYTDVDVLDDTVQVTLAGTASEATWGAARTSDTVITLTNGITVVAAGSVIRIKIGTNTTNQSVGVRQIKNPTTNGNKVIAISGTFTDTGSITVPILTDDQIAVTATVDQSLTFSISDNSIGFGTLSASAARFATGDTLGSTTENDAHTLVVGTNAGSGYTMSLSGTTLTSGSFTIATSSTNAAVVTGTEQFGIRMTATDGSGTVSAPYAAGTGYAFDSVNFPDQIASATAATANTTYGVRYVANIASNTEAGSYTSTLTYTASANF